MSQQPKTHMRQYRQQKKVNLSSNQSDSFSSLVFLAIIGFLVDVPLFLSKAYETLETIFAKLLSAMWS